MQRRLPKRGFVNQFRIETFPINLDQLERFDDGEVTLDMLRDAGLVPKKAKLVKILGRGEITKKLSVQAHRFSKTAAQKLEAAGGSAQVMAPAKRVKKASDDATETA
jgi:large subunit ribosomal protein L15